MARSENRPGIPERREQIIGRTREWEILDTPITDQDLEKIQAAVSTRLPNNSLGKQARALVEIMIQRKNAPIPKTELMTLLNLDVFADAPERLNYVLTLLHRTLVEQGIFCLMRVIIEQRHTKDGSQRSLDKHFINRAVKFYHVRPKQSSG